MKKRFATLLMMLCLLAALAVPAYAADEAYVFETTGVMLDAEGIARLEQQCADAADAYGCGIYIVTLYDFSEYHPDPFEAAQVIYRSMDFGVGENKNGIMLMLSLSERDYALICYGDIANSVFTDRMQIAIEEDFLDNFGANDWDGGLTDFVENSISALAGFDGEIGESYDGYYENGVYYEPTFGSRLVYVVSEYWYIIGAVSLIVALVVCLILKSGMKTARKATHAGNYISENGVKLSVRQDTFTHTTRQVIHHESNNSGGSGGGGRTSVGSSGFSGRSGKF
ncbi:MAG: TPM domain-containing protein [Oscillospiraceae bacterium]|nr:TPM domain-containing protein [Oscillospiraceae bacterium]